MHSPDSPISNLGPLALRDLLTEGVAAAHTRLRHLSLSELAELAVAVDQLAWMARYYVNRICGECKAPIFWHPNPPTGQAARWRHVDQPAVYRHGSHRAYPDHDSTFCPTS